MTIVDPRSVHLKRSKLMSAVLHYSEPLSCFAI
jgi:hypothetical protein